MKNKVLKLSAIALAVGLSTQAIAAANPSHKGFNVGAQLGVVGAYDTLFGAGLNGGYDWHPFLKTEARNNNFDLSVGPEVGLNWLGSDSYSYGNGFSSSSDFFDVNALAVVKFKLLRQRNLDAFTGLGLAWLHSRYKFSGPSGTLIDQTSNDVEFDFVLGAGYHFPGTNWEVYGKYEYLSTPGTPSNAAYNGPGYRGGFSGFDMFWAGAKYYL